MGVYAHLLTLLLIPIYLCCSSINSAGAGSIAEPPFPRTKSILPLALDNRWTYSYTAYDSIGKIIPNNLDAHLSVSEGYGLIGDTVLITRNNIRSETQVSAYVYQYAWENQQSGYLIVYRDLYPLEKRGLYVVGEFSSGRPVLYPRERLWLAYPADSGKTWHFPLDTTDTNFNTIELVSTRAKFYIPDPNSMTALSFYECYEYKETSGKSTYLYYFNEHIGQLGYKKYVDGKLMVTYLLKSYSIAQ